MIIGLPFLLLLSVTVASRVNQGHRYILFLYVPLSVWLGAIADRMLRAGRTLRWVAGILLAGYLASFALAYPHCLTYFNVLGGSPYKASAILGDTNTDWGQDILDLSVYLEKNGIEKVNMALFGLNLPDGYGIRNYNWIGLGDAPPLVPSERIVARPDPSLPTVLSVNNLVLARKAFPGMFDREPDADLNSIVVYLPAGRSDGDLP